MEVHSGLEDIYKHALAGGFTENEQIFLFFGVVIAFAIKVPLVPLHTWLPDAYKNAPIVANVLLAGIMAKVGTYAFLRIAIPTFPYAMETFAILFMVLALISIIYGAVLAYSQNDLKLLLAYSSISHLGFIVLGLFAYQISENSQGLVYQALSGAIYQMFNHGIIIGGLFLVIGMIHERTKSYEVFNYGGMAKVMPKYAVIFMLLMLASVGLPGTSSFVGEILIIVGTIKANMLIGIISTLGIILSVVYMLLMYQRLFFGPLRSEMVKSLKDINTREMIILVPLILIIIIGGLIPSFFLDKVDINS